MEKHPGALEREDVESSRNCQEQEDIKNNNASAISRGKGTTEKDSLIPKITDDDGEKISGGEPGIDGVVPISPLQPIPTDSPKFAENHQDGLCLDDLPSEVLIHIFGFLTYTEKLRMEKVSKQWQSCVNLSLRSETSFCLERGKGCSHVDRMNEAREIKAQLWRMSKPLTGDTNLITFEIRNVYECQFQHLVDGLPKCPKLRNATLPFYNSMPPFLFQSQSLRTIQLGQISRRQLSLILTKFPELKDLKLRQVNVDDILRDITDKRAFFDISDPEVAKKVKTGIFQGAGCSLRSLTINPLPGDAMQSLVDSFPDLKELRLEGYLRHACSNFIPLINLHSRILKISGLDFEDCINEMDESTPIMKFLLHLTRHSPLITTLEQLQIECDQPRKPRLLRKVHPSSLEPIAIFRNLKVLHFSQREGEKDVCFAVNTRYDVGTMFQKENLPFLEDLWLPCVKLDDFCDCDEFNLPQLKGLRFCGCLNSHESLVIRFAVVALKNSISLLYLHITNFLLQEDLFRQMAQLLSDGRFIELKFTGPCRGSWKRYPNCSSYIHEFDTLAKRYGLHLKLSTRFCDCH